MKRAPSPQAPESRLRQQLVVGHARDEENEELRRPLQWHLIRRLFGYTTPVAGKRNALIVFTLVRALQLPGLAWLVGEIIAGPIAGGEVTRAFWWVVGYLVLAVSTDVLFHFRQRYAQELGEMVVTLLRRDIFTAVARQPMAFFHRAKLGSIIGRMTSDVQALRVGIQDVLFVSLVQCGQMLGAAAVMAFTDWVMFLVVVAMAPVLWALNRHFSGRLSAYSRASQASFSRVTANLAESVNGIRVTQGFVREDLNAGLFRELIADHARYNISLARTSAILMPLLELNSQFFVAVLLLLGGWRSFHGYMEVGDLITFFFLTNLFFSPIQTLGRMFEQALIAMAGAERVFRLIDRVPEWRDAADAEALPDPRGTKETARGATPGGPLGVAVEFRNVSFGYDVAKPVLHDVSFAVAPGQSIALVGHTGSGKSSIINLVGKFYLPDAGRILIDGREIRAVTSESLHRQMGMVTQQNFLFSGTVRDNIRHGRPEASDAEVRAATDALGCVDLIEALPQGFDTEVGERGAGLSLGQRQLVCFARAMLADPRLVILDEATSAIDAITEERLQAALRTLLAGRTSFVVAHRLSTIRDADLVLVLDRGRVIERGNHAELMSCRGHYAALYAQFVQVDDRG